MIDVVKSAAASEQLKGILGWTDGDAVSSDFIGEKCSSIVDVKAGMQRSSSFIKLVSW